MSGRTLSQYFESFYRRGNDIAFAHRRGYRVLRWSYRRTADVACRFARELESRRIGKGDRVLLWGYYVIPNWHVRVFRVAYWNKFSQPAISPKYTLDLFTWWVDPEKAARLKQEKADLASGVGAGGIHISMSTVAPATSRRLAGHHTSLGNTYIAAPVFGRPPVEAHAFERLDAPLFADHLLRRDRPIALATLFLRRRGAQL